MTAELGPIIFVFQNIRLFKIVKMLTAIKFRKGLCLRVIPETDLNEGEEAKALPTFWLNLALDKTKITRATHS